jgi:hypothetical protein
VRIILGGDIAKYQLVATGAVILQHQEESCHNEDAMLTDVHLGSDLRADRSQTIQ